MEYSPKRKHSQAFPDADKEQTIEKKKKYPSNVQNSQINQPISTLFFQSNELQDSAECNKEKLDPEDEKLIREAFEKNNQEIQVKTEIKEFNEEDTTIIPYEKRQYYEMRRTATSVTVIETTEEVIEINEEKPAQSKIGVVNDLIDKRIANDSNDLLNTKILGTIESSISTGQAKLMASSYILKSGDAKTNQSAEMPEHLTYNRSSKQSNQKVLMMNSEHRSNRFKKNSLLAKFDEELNRKVIVAHRSYHNSPRADQLIITPHITTHSFDIFKKIFKQNDTRNISSGKEDTRISNNNAYFSNILDVDILQRPDARIVKIKKDAPLISNPTVLAVLDSIETKFKALRTKKIMNTALKSFTPMLKKLFKQNESQNEKEGKEISLLKIKEDTPLISNPTVLVVLDSIETRYKAQKTKKIMNTALKSFNPMLKKLIKQNETRNEKEGKDISLLKITEVATLVSNATVLAVLDSTEDSPLASNPTVLAVLDSIETKFKAQRTKKIMNTALKSFTPIQNEKEGKEIPLLKIQKDAPLISNPTVLVVLDSIETKFKAQRTKKIMNTALKSFTPMLKKLIKQNENQNEKEGKEISLLNIKEDTPLISNPTVLVVLDSIETKFKAQRTKKIMNTALKSFTPMLKKLIKQNVNQNEKEGKEISLLNIKEDTPLISNPTVLVVLDSIETKFKAQRTKKIMNTALKSFTPMLKKLSKQNVNQNEKEGKEISLLNIKEDTPLVSNSTVLAVLDSIETKFKAQRTKKIMNTALKSFTPMLKKLSKQNVNQNEKEGKEISLLNIKEDTPLVSNSTVLAVLDSIETKFKAQQTKKIMNTALKSFTPMLKRLIKQNANPIISSEKNDPSISNYNANFSNSFDIHLFQRSDITTFKVQEDVPVLSNPMVWPVLHNINTKFINQIPPKIKNTPLKYFALMLKKLIKHNDNSIISSGREDTRITNHNFNFFDVHLFQRPNIPTFKVKEDIPALSNPNVCHVLESISTKFNSQNTKKFKSLASKPKKHIKQKNNLYVSSGKEDHFQKKEISLLKIKEDVAVARNPTILAGIDNSYTKFPTIPTIKILNLIQAYQRHHVQYSFHGWKTRLSCIGGIINIYFNERESSMTLNSPKSLQKIFKNAKFLPVKKLLRVKTIRKFKEDQSYVVVNSLLAEGAESLFNVHDQLFRFHLLSNKFLHGCGNVINFKEIQEASLINEFMQKRVPHSIVEGGGALCSESVKIKISERASKLKEFDGKTISIPILPKISIEYDLQQFKKIIKEKKPQNSVGGQCLNLAYYPRGKAFLSNKMPSMSINHVYSETVVKSLMNLKIPSSRCAEIMKYRALKPDERISQISKKLIPRYLTPDKMKIIFNNLIELLIKVHQKTGFFNQEVKEFEKKFSQINFEVQYKKIQTSKFQDSIVQIKSAIIIFFEFFITCINIIAQKKISLDKENSTNKGDYFGAYIRKFRKIYHSLTIFSSSLPLAITELEKRVNKICCDFEKCFEIHQTSSKILLYVNGLANPLSFKIKKLISCKSDYKNTKERYQKEIGNTIDFSESDITISDSVQKTNLQFLNKTVPIFNHESPSPRKEKTKAKYCLFNSLQKEKHQGNEKNDEINHLIVIIQVRKSENNYCLRKLSSLKTKTDDIELQIKKGFEGKNYQLFTVIKVILLINLICFIFLNYLRD